MKLDEILLVSNTAKGNANIVRQRIGQAKHIKDDIYEFSVMNHDFFCILDKGNLIAFLHGSKVNIKFLPNSFVINEIWVDPKFRNKGHALSLYRYLYVDLEYTVISDTQQTLGGKKIWDSLRQQFGDDVVLYDNENNSIVKSDSVPKEDLYCNNTKDNLDKRYRLVLKKGEALKESIGIPNIGCGILAPMIKFTDNIDWI